MCIFNITTTTMTTTNDDLRVYIDFEYFNNLYQKYVDWYKVSTQDIMMSVKWISRFRKDGLRDKACSYALDLWRQKILFSKVF